MSDGKKYYCFCGSNCKYETMTKEQIMSAIAQATGVTEVDPNAGFISKVLEKNSGHYVSFWVGSQAQYNALQDTDENCLYIITDDTTKEDFEKAVAEVTETANNAAAVAGEAKQEAENARAAARSSMAVDFTKDVALSFAAGSGGNNLTFVKATPVNYIYIPTANLVFYSFYLEYTGAMSEFETMDIIQYGGYRPLRYAGAEVMPCNAAAGSLLAADYMNYSSTYNHAYICFTPKKAFDTKGIPFGTYFSGWYFSDASNLEVTTNDV